MARTVFLLLLGAAVYWPVVSFEFVRWDDDINYTRNPLLTDPWTWDLVGRFFQSDQTLRFRPLHWLLVRLLHDGWGFDPRAWHVFGLVLHLGAAVLFLSVLRRVLRQWFAALAPVAAWSAWFAAALWTVHPLRAETVAWCTASTYLLTALCLLGSFRCYLEANVISEARARIHRGWMTAACIFALLGYASYPVGCTFGLWLLAVDRWLLRIGPRPYATAGILPQSGWWGKHAAFLVPALLAVGLTIWTRVAQPGIFGRAPSMEDVGLPVRGLMALASAGYYVKALVWPGALTPNITGLALNAENGFTVGAFALLASVAAWLSWRNRVRRPLVALVVLGTGLLAIPVLGLTERPHWPVDRYSYLVHLPLLGAVAIGWLRVRRWSRRAVVIFAGVGVLVVACAAVATRRQIMIWRDSGSLFTHMAQRPEFADGRGQSANILILWAFSEAAGGNTDRSRELMAAAREIIVRTIDDALSHGDYGEALSLTAMLEQHFTISPVMRREKGAWLMHVGQIQEALVELQTAQVALGEDERTAALLREAQARTVPP